MRTMQIEEGTEAKEERGRKGGKRKGDRRKEEGETWTVVASKGRKRVGMSAREEWSGEESGDEEGERRISFNTESLRRVQVKREWEGRTLPPTPPPPLPTTKPTLPTSHTTHKRREGMEWLDKNIKETGKGEGEDEESRGQKKRKKNNRNRTRKGRHRDEVGTRKKQKGIDERKKVGRREA